MNSTSPSTVIRQGFILAALALLMIATRFHHEGTPFALPDASLGVFFLAGLFLNSPLAFVTLLGLAFAIDYVAVTAFGVSGYCISPAYAFLVPTYAVMWFGGRYFERLSSQGWNRDALLLAIAIIWSASSAFLISNFSFYWFSGELVGVGILEYSFGLMREYPVYLGAASFYVLSGLGVDALLRTLANIHARRADSLEN